MLACPRYIPELHIFDFFTVVEDCLKRPDLLGAEAAEVDPIDHTKVDGHF